MNAIVAAACTAVAVLVVGIINVVSQRNLQRNQQTAEISKITREEKKTAYIKVLAGCREAQITFQLLADSHPQSLIANLEPAAARVEAQRDA